MEHPMIIPHQADIMAGANAFETHERRDAMYKVASFLVDHFWGDPTEMADGLGVLLLTWNQALYRYGIFDFDILEHCIAGNMPSLAAFRARDIISYLPTEDEDIQRLFNEFLDALRIREPGKRPAKSPVAVAKALHLLAPGFFPLWDEKIAKEYGCRYSSKPAAKYLKFMAQMKAIAASLDPGFIRSLGRKSPLKVIDEFNYSKITKRWI
jgi:hypothetical protein